MSIRLEGSTIHIRTLVPSDKDAIYEYAKHKDLAKYTTLPSPYTLDNAIFFIGFTKRKIKKEQSFELGIIDNKTNRLIGMIGLSTIDKTNNSAEIGYWLGKPYWGKKVMKQAVPLMLNFGFKQQKFKRIYARVMHVNEPSINLLKKNGFILEGCLRKAIYKHNKWFDEVRLSLLKEEYKKTA